MSKYTTTIEEYIQGRHFAQVLADAESQDTLPDDPRTLWIQAVSEVNSDPDIGYQIVADEIFPDSSVPFYTDDTTVKDEFLKAWTDTFYFDEIGQETMGRFRITLRAYFRDNMPRFADLYASRLSGLAALASDYQRQTHDSNEKLGSEQRSMQHGLKVDFTPGATTTNKIIPLGGSAETELNQSLTGGKDVTENSGTDTDTLSFTNRIDSRWITENITGTTGLEKAELTAKYRELILDLDSMIFADMRAKHLFMEVW